MTFIKTDIEGEDYRYRAAGSEALYETLDKGTFPGDARCPFISRFRDDVNYAEYVKYVNSMGAPK